MIDENEPYRLYDNKERAFVSQKEYASEATANKTAERKNLEHGSHRYSAEKYSDVVQRNTPTSGGGGAMPKSNRDITKNYKSGGMVSSASKRADGCCIKGKTKGKMV